MTANAQEQQLAALKTEISNLDRAFEMQLKDLGLTIEELAEPLPDDEYGLKMLKLAQEAATRAGQARADQYTAETTKSAPLPGAGRKGAMHL